MEKKMKGHGIVGGTKEDMQINTEMETTHSMQKKKGGCGTRFVRQPSKDSIAPTFSNNKQIF